MEFLKKLNFLPLKYKARIEKEILEENLNKYSLSDKLIEEIKKPKNVGFKRGYKSFIRQLAPSKFKNVDVCNT